ncbi:hypothetical protein GCM10027417_30530 [Glutamicibacter endophyticus]
MSVDPIENLLKLSDTMQGLPDGPQAGFEYADADWRDIATRAARELGRTEHPFTVDSLRRWGVPDPDKPERWGALFAGLARQKIIQFHGLALHRGPGGRVSAIRVWVGGPEAVKDRQAA